VSAVAGAPAEVAEVVGDIRSRLRWDIWTRVFRFQVMPSRPVLHRLILERDALGTELWNAVMEPALAARVPALFNAAGTPAMRRTAMDLRRVGASAYALAGSFYYLHGNRPEAARRAGVAAMWLAQAAAVMDYLLDETSFDPQVLRGHLHPDVITAALPPAGDTAREIHHFDAPPFDPELTFVLAALEHGFAGLRECFALGADDAYHRRLREDLVVCLHQMIGAELASPGLRIDRCDYLDDVERTLRGINTLPTWLFAYAGLATEPAPAEPLIDGVLRAAQLVGDIGWTLDALEDVIPDLENRIWNRAWLMLAQTCYRRDPADWRALIASPEQALEQLAGSAVFDQLLADIERSIAEIAADARLPTSACAALADVCRLLVWSFLATEDPPRS
jgi:hypothetical protein